MILLYSEGYEAERKLQHYGTIQALPKILGAEKNDDAVYLDTCRAKRNTAEYDSVGVVLGHTKISTTERYSKVSNVKVRRDYENAMRIIVNGRSNGTRANGYKKFFTKDKLKMVMKNLNQAV
jgi:hypothetical protein